VSQSTSTSRDLELAPAETVEPGARVRHFDELSEDAQAFLIENVTEPTAEFVPVDLLHGDVVVFNRYVHVTRR
jgi:hypothetical protein